MKKADLSGMFSDRNWIQLNRNHPQLKGIFPNYAWRNDVTNQSALVVVRSDKGDFPTGQTGLQKLEEVKKKRQGYVVLVEEKNGKFKYINHETCLNILNMLKKQKPFDGKYGPYWWLNDDFELVDSKAINGDSF